MRSKLVQWVSTAQACAIAWLMLAGCAPNRGDEYVQKLAEAKRAQSAGRASEAAADYDAAANLAKVPRDRVFCTYLAGLAYASVGNDVQALAHLRAVDDESYSAVAHYRIAEIALRRGNEADGFAALQGVVDHYPSHGVARSALYRILAKKDGEEGPATSARYLARLYAHAPQSDLAEVLLYQQAKRERLAGDTPGALTVFLKVANDYPYPKGVHFDDALAAASEIEEELGHIDLAIVDLQRMLNERESSHVMGSYERPRFAPSALRIAKLLEKKGDSRGAADAFFAFYKDFASSTDRDDALWKAADIWQKLGEPERACSLRAELAHTFTDSRYVPCATVRCPFIERPKGSKAPNECRDYLLRGSANNLSGTANFVRADAQ